MAFWSGEKLAARGPSIFSPYEAARIDRNAYVLSMGDRYFRTADQEEADGTHQVRTILSSGEEFAIPPGQFAFLLCKETITVPMNAMALISMRTPLKFQGLINVSGFHVDPGYSGKLVYAVFNASPSPVRLRENEPAFKIWFGDLDHGSTPIDSATPYVAGPSEGLFDITNTMMRGMSGEILSLQSLAKKLKDQGQAMENKFSEQKPIIDNLNFVMRALTIGVVVAIFAIVAAAAIPPMWALGKAVAARIAS